MTPEVALSWSELIKGYFVQLVDVVKGAASLASKEVPLYLQELIKYEIGKGIVWALFWLFVTGIFLYAVICCHNAANGKNKLVTGDNKEAAAVVKWIMIGLTIVIPASLFFHSVESAVKAYVAPRVIIVEKIQETLQGFGKK